MECAAQLYETLDDAGDGSPARYDAPSTSREDYRTWAQRSDPGLCRFRTVILGTSLGEALQSVQSDGTIRNGRFRR
jgi:hypothetical protein